MVCAQRGYDCVICMAEPFSVERRRLMRMLGAKVIVTPKAGKGTGQCINKKLSRLGFHSLFDLCTGTGMVRKAEELCEKHGWFLCHQFENEANWKFHEETTGPEILGDFDGKRLDYWVTGYGTGGTFHGAGKARGVLVQRSSPERASARATRMRECWPCVHRRSRRRGPM